MQKASTSEIETLIEHLNSKASKPETVSFSKYIIQHPYLINELYHLIFRTKIKGQWRAAWLFEHIFLENKDLIAPYIEDMIKRFPELKKDGIKRHFSKILAFSDINDLLNGEIINTCFDWIIAEETPVAVKANCMHILYNATKKYPELKPELKMILEEQFHNNSAGFKSRAKKILKEIG